MSTLLDADLINVTVQNPDTPFGGVIVDLPDVPVVVELDSTTAPVTSVFGRIGDIIALQADYAAFYAPLGGGLPGGGTVGQVLTLASSTPNVAAWEDAPGGTPHAPTALVGLTVVNGSAATYMRSDAAPPIDVSIAPTWSGIHTFTLSPIVPDPTTAHQAASKGYVDSLPGGVPSTRTLTIGGTALDLSANRAWTTDTILGLSGNGFVKRTGANTYTNDGSTYLTGNQTITLTGDTTGSGATAITTVTSNLTGAVAELTSTGTTNAIVNAFQSNLHCTGTPTTGFGQRWTFNLDDSTTANSAAGDFSFSWANAVHATRAGLFALRLTNAAPAANVLTISAAGNGVFTGTLAASNLSGSNTGDQTNITGSAASLSISGQTGLLSVTGLLSTNRIKTVRDAADTILELGGSYTPTGTWTSLTMVTPVLGTPTSGNLANCTFPTLNQDTTGKSAKTDALNSATTVVNVAAATAPVANQVLTATDSTHATWQTPAAGFVNPMTTLGDIIYENVTPAAARLAGNTTSTKNFLTQTGTGSVSAVPAWGTIATGDVPTLNQNTTGSAASLSISGQTGLLTVTGLTSTNRIKTVRDAADTILELGGSYTPTGTWTGMAMVDPTGLDSTDVGLANVTNDVQTKASIVPNTAPSAGQILVGNAGGTAYAPVTVSGSGATITVASTGVHTISGIANASLTNSSITIGGSVTALGGTVLGNVTNDTQTKSAIVPNTAPSAGQILAGNAGGTAYAPVTLSGSGATATLSSAGVLTLSAIANATLTNSAITIAGTSTALGGTITQDTITGLAANGFVKRTGANTLTNIATVTGWTASTGSDLRTGYATSTVTLDQVAQTLKSLISDLFTFGIISA